MVEPATAVAFSHFFTSASRPLLRPALPAHSAFRSALLAITGAVAHAVSARPVRRVKARPQPRLSLSLEEECRRWLSEMGLNQQMFALAHTLWCPDRDRLFMWKEVIPQRHNTSVSSSGDRLLCRDNLSRISPFRSFLRHASSAAAHHERRPNPMALLAHNHVKSNAFVPEDSWHAWTTIRDGHNYPPPAPGELLSFAEALVDRVYSSSEVSDARQWGLRVTELLQYIRAQHISTSLPPDKAVVSRFRAQCLAASASALRGDLDGCQQQLDATELRVPNKSCSGYLLGAYASLFKAGMRHDGPLQGFELIVKHWETLLPHLDLPKAHPNLSSFNRAVRGICESVDSPADVLRTHEESWDEAKRRRAGDLLIEALCGHKLARDALGVLDELKRQGLAPPLLKQLPVVRALVRTDNEQAANLLYTEITDEWGASSRKDHEYLVTGLYLFAHQGHEDFAQQYFDELHHTDYGDETLLIHASAVRGNTVRAVEIFEHLFSPDKPKTRSRRAQITHYTAVIHAHAQADDFDGMNQWLAKMMEAGYTPDEHVYNTILHGFARRGELQSVTETLEQMRAAGCPPSVHSYTALIQLLGNKRDSYSAEQIFKRAMQEGLQPDQRMFVALMNAHVEAGTWKGVIRAYDWLCKTKHRHIRLGVQVYNTLLKAYVLIGAPFRVVASLYRRMEDSHIRPDDRSFALLIQSACDAGRMDTATQILREMEKRADDWLNHLQVNVYGLTIIMAGHLRLGQADRARVVYEEMRQRGIQPTSVTFASILSSYANQGTEEGIARAREFLAELMRAPERRLEWMRPTGGRASPLQHVYSPLLAVYARDPDKVHEVEELVQEMLDHGAQPSLDNLIFLLDAYRRNGNIEALQQLWRQLYDIAMSTTHVDALLKEGKNDSGRRPPNPALCVPLSIYVDALSASGLHLDIARTWGQLKADGFTFNSHNWNHLAVALVRAGEPTRAFEIVEHVILPYQRQAQRFVAERDRDPDSPLLFEPEPEPEFLPEAADTPSTSATPEPVENVPVEEAQLPAQETLLSVDEAQSPADDAPMPAEEAQLPLAESPSDELQPEPNIEPEPSPSPQPEPASAPIPPAADLPNEAAMRQRATRALMVEHATQHAATWLSREPADVAAHAADFAHPLHILHQVSPAWRTWAPHGATLAVLHQALRRLHGGLAVGAVSADRDGEGEGEMPVEEREAAAREAVKLAGWIHDEYPRTCAAVAAWHQAQEQIRERREQRR